ncbi:SpaH/EbpB family LPXTG-anchored major pilin [Microbacterium natoriense]|uniref:SpaH/EbpB family LPXTG-anchored major pilin n=1 Tax=Microbacterium natoriense TaxID=284570 RepID=UPI0031E13A27
MTALTHPRGRRILAIGAALTLGALGILATSLAASAAEIDPDQTGSITIHKFANPGNGAANPDGTGTLPDTEPIADVVFEVCAIDGIDLVDGTNTGWDALNAITQAEKLAAGAQGTATLGAYALSGCEEVTTSADGTVSTGALPVGPYFVREIDAPAGVIAPAIPFIVTVPTPAVNTGIAGAPLDGEWVYDVNVYPKNTLAESPRKNVVRQDDNGAALGAPVTYQVTTKIPALAAGETYDVFAISDTLDPALTPNTDLSTLSVAVGGGAAFVQGADYTATWAGQTLTVSFTAAGLAKLEAGQNVVLTFDAAANAVGEIQNQAFVNLNGFQLTPGVPNGPGGSPTDIVETRWGSLTVKKVNAADAQQGLAGARFEIYMGTTDAAGCIADIDDLSAVTAPGTTSPLVVSSDADGSVVFPGLWVGDTEKTVAADGTVSDVAAPGHDYMQRCYVLKEIAAPAGFILPAGAAALTEVVVAAGDNGTVALIDIPNTQQGVPTLPFTGADGQLALMIAGAALAVIAVGGVLVSRRRKAAEEA